MKRFKYFVPLAMSLVLVLGVYVSAVSTASATADKIEICHKTGNTWEYRNTPSGTALDAHMDHGDFLYEGSEELSEEGKAEWCMENAPEEEENNDEEDSAWIEVIKRVINDDGGTAEVSDFTLFIEGGEETVTVTSGSLTEVMPGTYFVTEEDAEGYEKSYDGKCYPDGNLTLAAGETKRCVIVNNDIAEEEPTDVCQNLPDVQTELPDGYHFNTNETECFPNEDEVIDVCPNILEDQETVPEGKHIDEESGDCVDDEVPPPTTECSDGVDNADPEDQAVDEQDPGCTGPTDDDETDPTTPPPPAVCADGLDNDGDEKTDYPADPGCSDANDDDETDVVDEEETPTNTPTSGGGGRRRGGSSIVKPQVIGEVLGESCGLSIDRYMRRGRTNDSVQVLKLQTLLNKHIGTSIPLTGFYGPITEAGVKSFQEKYAAQILTPWGLTAPTGIAYQTTLRQINLIECPELSLQVPSLVEWSKNPNVNLPVFSGAVTAGL
jgi:hypothetical protein